MMTASTYLRRNRSRTIAAWSIHGTGDQSLLSALRSGCGRVRRCVWTELRQPTADFVARQVVLRGSWWFGE